MINPYLKVLQMARAVEDKQRIDSQKRWPVEYKAIELPIVRKTPVPPIRDAIDFMHQHGNAKKFLTTQIRGLSIGGDVSEFVIEWHEKRYEAA